MIKADQLAMEYGPVRALAGVSFEVATGEIVGLLGPNGAGKSTTMKILTTFLHPSAGTAVVGGVDVIKDPLAVRRKIGYLPETPPLYMDMEVREYLSFVGRARGLRGSDLERRTGIVLEACGLEPMYRRVVRNLSKGYKQRTALAQALIHDPEIIILDEPTSGLDPHQIIEVRHLVRELAAGKTVILSTHILQEVEASCDRIVIIDRGQIVGDGTYDELSAKAKDEERVQVRITDAPEDVERLLSGISGVRSVDDKGEGTYIVHAKSGTEVGPEIFSLATSKGWKLAEFTRKPPTLEETFLNFTKGERGGEGEAA